jgi:predicted phosphoribosyltransferase
MLFQDRFEAGRILASRLSQFAQRNDVIVLGLPRGGIPVAFEVAKALNSPLDVFVVRKLGVPGREELAMGAIASSGIRVVNRAVVDALGIKNDEIEEAATEQRAELERREREYRSGRPMLDVHNRTVILIDDGLATGSSMRVAVMALRKREPGRIVIAVPVAAPSTCEELESEADQVVCAVTPEPFLAVGQWYRDFRQTSDDEVHKLLDRANQFGAPRVA